MDYKEAFTALKEQIQGALTDYEEAMNKATDLLAEKKCAIKLYNHVVHIVNSTEHWEIDK